MNNIQKIILSLSICGGHMINASEPKEKKMDAKAKIAMWQKRTDQTEKQSDSGSMPSLISDTTRSGLNVAPSIITAPSSASTPSKSESSIVKKFQIPIENRAINETLYKFNGWIKTIQGTSSWDKLAQDILTALEDNNKERAAIQFSQRTDIDDLSIYKYAILEQETNNIAAKYKQYFLALNQQYNIQSGSDLYQKIIAALNPMSPQEIRTLGDTLFESHVKKTVYQDLGLLRNTMDNTPIFNIINDMTTENVIRYIKAGLDAIKTAQKEINALSASAGEKEVLKKELRSKQGWFSGPRQEDPAMKKLTALREQERQLKQIRDTYIITTIEFLKRTFSSEQMKQIQPLRDELLKIKNKMGSWHLPPFSVDFEHWMTTYPLETPK